MGAVQLADDLHLVIERRVAEGRATSTADFVQEAVTRLLNEGRDEETEIEQAVIAGLADAAAGRMVSIATDEDTELLHQRLMSRVQVRLAADA